MKRVLRGRLGLAVVILSGMLLGTGAFTFDYAEGTSYFSSDPTSCVNCHIMNPQFDAWQKASHHTVAKCVDCHLPHDFVGKYMAKADHGFWHSYGFTFQNFHEPIRMKERSTRHVQANCVKCHDDMVHNLVAGAKTDADAVSCIHCHSDVGHGPMK